MSVFFTKWLATPRIEAGVDMAIGLALAFILQTQYRFSIGFGIGEIILGLCVLVGLSIGLVRYRVSTTIQTADGMGIRMVWLMVAYLVLIMLPVTMYQTWRGVIGSSLRDWMAYCLAITLLLSLAVRKPDFGQITAVLAIALIGLLGFSLVFGDDAIWFPLRYGRFRGGSENPNQLALYMLCALMMSITFLSRGRVFLIAVVGLMFFGILAKSSAYNLGAVVFVVACLAAWMVPYHRLRTRFPLSFLILFVLVLVFRAELLDIVSNLWAKSDYHNSRIDLYRYGIEAWLSSGYSFILGNGAGNFSGLTGMFQGSEAHNTGIDALTIGGFPFLWMTYVFSVCALWQAYRRGEILIFGVISALLTFSMFHYIGRHPIYWFSVYGVFVYFYSMSARGVAGVCIDLGVEKRTS